MTWSDMVIENLEWMIFFGILLFLAIIIYIFSNSLAKSRVFLTILCLFTLLLMTIIIEPYNYIILLVLVICILFLLIGKWNTHLTTQYSDNIYISQEKTVWDEYEYPPESNEYKISEKEVKN